MNTAPLKAARNAAPVTQAETRTDKPIKVPDNRQTATSKQILATQPVHKALLKALTETTHGASCAVTLELPVILALLNRAKTAARLKAHPIAKRATLSVE